MLLREARLLVEVLRCMLLLSSGPETANGRERARMLGRGARARQPIAALSLMWGCKAARHSGGRQGWQGASASLSRQSASGGNQGLALGWTLASRG